MDSSKSVSGDVLREIAAQTYIYAYPMVLMDITRRQMTNYSEPTEALGRGPANQFTHAKAFPDASSRDVVRANLDTLHSVAWLDLSDGPVVISVPDTNGRYCLLPMLDMWTDVFESLGSRTTGDEAKDFVVIGPGWCGELPDGMEIIQAPTEMVWIIGRIQTNGNADYENVRSIQDGLSVTPLSHWGEGEYVPQSRPVDPSVDMTTPPIDQVARMDAAAFFERFAELLKTNPPHLNDQPIIHRMKRIGIVPGESFSMSSARPEVQSALVEAIGEAKRLISGKVHYLAQEKNNWQMLLTSVGTYGTDYMQRAAIAYGGLGANVPEDAIYPTTFLDSTNAQLNGSRQYVLHFSADEIPPINAFWSLTMYGSDQFFVDNPLGRYALGDRDNLRFNHDGSLDIYIQHDSPGADKESNWLPAPPDHFSLTLRLYWPKASVIQGKWVPPAVQAPSEMEWEAEERRKSAVGRSWTI